MNEIRKKFRKGFILVELPTVLVIIGIMVIGAVPKITGAPIAARDTARKAYIHNIMIGIEMYLNENGVYPDSNSGGECINANSETGSKIKVFLGDSIPRDPFPKDKIFTSNTACSNGFFYYTHLCDEKHENCQTGYKVEGYLVAAGLEDLKGNNEACFVERDEGGEISKYRSWNECNDVSESDYSKISTSISKGIYYIGYNKL